MEAVMPPPRKLAATSTTRVGIHLTVIKMPVAVMGGIGEAVAVVDGRAAGRSGRGTDWEGEAAATEMMMRSRRCSLQAPIWQDLSSSHQVNHGHLPNLHIQLVMGDKPHSTLPRSNSCCKGLE